MTKINEYILVENKKPVEIVSEYKNETLSFEEFMKGYENGGTLNYSDLSGSSVSESKGYGPCEYSGCSYYTTFNLKIEAINEGLFTNDGGEYSEKLSDVQDARNALHNITSARGTWGNERVLGIFRNRNLNSDIRTKLAKLLVEAINHHENGGKVNGWIVVRESGWGKLSWSHSY